MAPEQIVFLAILVTAIGPLITEKLRPDLVALRDNPSSSDRSFLLLTPFQAQVRRPRNALVAAAVMLGTIIAATLSQVGLGLAALSGIIYAPGGYRFADYTRVGAPLTVIRAIEGGAILAPVVWPT